MKVDSTVHDILSHKASGEVCTIGPSESVFEALKTMALRDISALLVVQDGEVVGIITEQDYARKVILRNRTSRTTKIGEIMERSVIYVLPSDSAEGCLRLMSEHRIRHLPVLEDGELRGLISMGDVVRALIHDREFLIDQLTHYITGSYVGWFDGPQSTTVSIEPLVVEHVTVQH